MEKKKNMKCQECGIENETVKTINCGFHEEVFNKEVKEVICEKCEHEHRMDI